MTNKFTLAKSDHSRCEVHTLFWLMILHILYILLEKKMEIS
jgi:hypothetical protein